MYYIGPDYDPWMKQRRSKFDAFSSLEKAQVNVFGIE